MLFNLIKIISVLRKENKIRTLAGSLPVQRVCIFTDNLVMDYYEKVGEWDHVF